MARLSLLGVEDHIAQNYANVYRKLESIEPDAVTLELRLLDSTANALLGALFVSSDDELYIHESNFLRKCLVGGEMRAGYVYSRRNSKPLYMADITILPPEEVVKHDINKAKNPLLLFPGFGDVDIEDHIERCGVANRNVYTAKCLDLLGEKYAHLAHIAGYRHIVHGSGVVPIQDIVKNFSDIEKYIISK